MQKVKVMLFIALMLPSATWAEWTGNFNLHVLTKQMDKDEWEPLDDQLGFALQGDFKSASWPISIALGYTSTHDSEQIPTGREISLDTDELDLGIKYIAENFKTFRPFIGAGICQLSIEAPAANRTLEASGPGFWLSGGAYWTLVEHVNLGVFGRLSDGSVDLEGVDVEAGGKTYGLLVGYHF